MVTTPDNAPPTISTEGPEDGDFFHVGQSVNLMATVSDDAALTLLNVRWSTNRGGDLGAAPIDSAGHAVLIVDDLIAGEHTLTAKVTDAEGLFDTQTIAITVDGRPSRPVIRLSPENPTTDDDLVVTIVHDALDANRSSDALSYRYRWFVDHVEREDQKGPTVPSIATLRGQSWTVRVAATDPYGYGDEAPASVIIGNAAPTCDAAVLLPPVATTVTSFTCICPHRDDRDSEDEALDTCVFYDDEAIVAEVPSVDGACVLPAAMTTRGMSIRCELTTADQSGPGESATTGAVLVDNSHPTQPKVSLSPEAGTVTDTFSCAIVAPSSDADDDGLTYEMAWFVNDYPNIPPPDGGPVTPLELSRDGAGTPARGGDGLRCEVHARDSVGELSAPAISDTVILGNTPPTGGVCTITPNEGVTATSVLNCEASEATDLDADPIDWTFSWTVTGPMLDPNSTGGALVDSTIFPPVTGSKLSGAYFDRDALVSCVATPHDGVASGPPVSCGEPVLVENTMPTIYEVMITPMEEIDCDFPLYAGDAECTGTVKLDQPLTCNVHGWYDPDTIDVVEVFYSWIEFDGEEISLEDPEVGGFGQTMTPQDAGLEPGDVFTCIARPYNADEEGDGVYAIHSAVVVAP